MYLHLHEILHVFLFLDITLQVKIFVGRKHVRLIGRKRMHVCVRGRKHVHICINFSTCTISYYFYLIFAKTSDVEV